jgi:tRNA G18 (ribose-2'-O)-methylase SpoU
VKTYAPFDSTIPTLPEGMILLEGAFLVERAVQFGLEVLRIACVPAREAWVCSLLAQVPERDTEAGGRTGEVAGGKAGEVAGGGSGRGFRVPLQAPEILPEAELADAVGYPFHRGVLAWARRPEAQVPVEVVAAAGKRILVLPGISDPENLGACFRNAAALGCGALLIGPQAPDPYSRRVLRVSMGASLNLPWARCDSGETTLEILKEAGFRSAACVLDPDAIDIRHYQPAAKLALILGNEAAGLPENWTSRCDDRVTLPMEGGTDSLNLATAAAVLLYALGMNVNNNV